MAHQQDRLTKIGLEGFDLIDKIYDGALNRRSNPTAGRFSTRPFGVTNVNEYQRQEEGVIGRREAAYKYQGIMVMDYHKTKSQHKGWGKMFNNFKF